jgi:hypothetical protein
MSIAPKDNGKEQLLYTFSTTFSEKKIVIKALLTMEIPKEGHKCLIT